MGSNDHPIKINANTNYISFIHFICFWKSYPKTKSFSNRMHYCLRRIRILSYKMDVGPGSESFWYYSFKCYSAFIMALWNMQEPMWPCLVPRSKFGKARLLLNEENLLTVQWSMYEYLCQLGVRRFTKQIMNTNLAVIRFSYMCPQTVYIWGIGTIRGH